MTHEKFVFNSLTAQLIVLEHHAEKIRESISDLKNEKINADQLQLDVIAEHSTNIISGSHSIRDQIQDLK